MNKILSLIFVIFLACGGLPSNAEDIGEATNALVSTDPCGVTISPYNAVCTKHSTWKCTSYNSTTHRCWQAHGTQPITGTYWGYRGTHPDFEVDGNVAWWPGRGTFLDHGEDGISNVMLLPRGLSVTAPSNLLTPGWSYANADLSPSGAVNGLDSFTPSLFTVYGGNYGISICVYTGANHTGQVGNDCFRAGPEDVTNWDMGLYGYPVIKSFQVF